MLVLINIDLKDFWGILNKRIVNAWRGQCFFEYTNSCFSVLPSYVMHLHAAAEIGLLWWVRQSGCVVVRLLPRGVTIANAWQAKSEKETKLHATGKNNVTSWKSSDKINEIKTSLTVLLLECRLVFQFNITPLL